MPESKRFLLRLDPRVFEALRRWAEDDLRSINGQIEYLLTDRVRAAGRLPHAPRRRREEPRDIAPDDEDDSIDSEEPAAARPR
jgi:hypothetical protein